MWCLIVNLVASAIFLIVYFSIELGKQKQDSRLRRGELVKEEALREKRKRMEEARAGLLRQEISSATSEVSNFLSSPDETVREAAKLICKYRWRDPDYHYSAIVEFRKMQQAVSHSFGEQAKIFLRKIKDLLRVDFEVAEQILGRRSSSIPVKDHSVYPPRDSISPSDEYRYYCWQLPFSHESPYRESLLRNFYPEGIDHRLLKEEDKAKWK